MGLKEPEHWQKIKSKEEAQNAILHWVSIAVKKKEQQRRIEDEIKSIESEIVTLVKRWNLDGWFTT